MDIHTELDTQTDIFSQDIFFEDPKTQKCSRISPKNLESNQSIFTSDKISHSYRKGGVMETRGLRQIPSFNGNYYTDAVHNEPHHMIRSSPSHRLVHWHHNSEVNSSDEHTWPLVEIPHPIQRDHLYMSPNGQQKPEVDSYKISFAAQTHNYRPIPRTVGNILHHAWVNSESNTHDGFYTDYEGKLYLV